MRPHHREKGKKENQVASTGIQISVVDQVASHYSIIKAIVSLSAVSKRSERVMAAAQDNTHDPATTIVKSLRNRQVHGLTTPEGTPAPEDDRIEAEKAPLLAHQPQSENLGVATQSKPAFEDEPDSDLDSEDDGSRVPNQKQIEMTQKLNALRSRQHRKILGVAESYPNPKEEKEAIMNAFRELIKLLHPVVNKAKGADKVCRSKSMVFL